MAVSSGPVPVRLFAAGLNAHRQLCDREGDVRTFEEISTVATDVLLSTWSTLSITTSTQLITTGYRYFASDLPPDKVFRSAIGDHNGLVAALDSSSRLHVLTGSSGGAPLLSVLDTNGNISISHMAQAGNGRVVATFRQTANANLTHVGEFASFDGFQSWWKDPTDSATYPTAHHMVTGRPRQLVANTATFAMLMEDGQVFTWGDPRHRSLARTIIDDGAVAADKPGLVDALAGLNIQKICAGGWMAGAVSDDGAAYLWGSGMPGKQSSIRCLEELVAGERAALIQLQVGDGETLDVVDLAIGNGHVAAVTEGGLTFAVGENRNGQLGLNSENPFMEDWTTVSHLPPAIRVICGPKSTLVFAK